MNEVPLARPEWNYEEYFSEKFKDITILICQRKTRDLIQICVTSILNHYPEIKILVADGNSDDNSIEWLRFMSAKYPNLKIWETGERRNSHGEIMHDAIIEHVTTAKVVLCDSDIIIRRGGIVEGMLEQFSGQHKPLYATGSLMIQSIKGEACSPAESKEDELFYAHPSFSMYDVETYKTLHRFTDHGAPCALNNIDAQSKGFPITYFPVDKYVQHLCGASWQDIPTVWNDDGDVQVRPLITFITYFDTKSTWELCYQKDHDFNVIGIGDFGTPKVSTYDRGILNGTKGIFDIRFKVNGHYVCELADDNLRINGLFIKQIREQAIEAIKNGNKEFSIDGRAIVERKHWQKYISIR